MEMVEAQFVELMVPLYSYGCGKKIKKALAHFKGIYSVNVDYKQQKVTVWGICNKNKVLSSVRAKRKGARFWNKLQDDIEAPPSPSSFCSMIVRGHDNNNNNIIGPLFSLKWKFAWKKVFNRSTSF